MKPSLCDSLALVRQQDLYRVKGQWEVRMASEVFEMVHPRKAPKGSKKSFACKSWRSKSVIWLFFVSLFSVPNLSWSRNPRLGCPNPQTTSGFSQFMQRGPT